MKSKEIEIKDFRAICQYCLRPCIDIWHLRNHIRKYHDDILAFFNGLSNIQPEHPETVVDIEA